MKLTKKEAKRLSILKWEYIVENNGSDDRLIEEYPELDELTGNCGYCEIYNPFSENRITDNGCSPCPLVVNKHPCTTTVWYVWIRKRNKKNAQAVLDLIKKS